MKRKIVKHGESTLTISLPSKWVKSNNIKQGQELNIDTQQEKMIISIEKKHYDTIQITFSKEEEGWAIGKILRHLYISGYDEIDINFTGQEQLEEIRKGLNVLTGMEVIESKHDKCKLRCVVSIDEAEYDSIIRRTLNLVSSQLEYLIDDCKSKKPSTYNEVNELFFTFSKLCNLSRRLINKKNIYNSIQGKYAYDFLNGLIEISLFIKYSYEHFKKNSKIDLKEKELDFVIKTNEFFQDLVLAYNNLNLNKVKNFSLEREKMFDKVLNLLNSRNAIIIHYFLMMLRNMTPIANHILMLKIDKEKTNNKNVSY